MSDGRMAEWIAGLIAEGAPGRLELAAEQGHPGGGLRSTFDRHWRLVICREGRLRMRVMRAGRAIELLLARGEALAIAPRTWVTTAPAADDAYASLGVVFRRDATRLLSVRCGRARPGAARSLARVAIEARELPRALDAEGRAWCESLRRERAQGGDEQRRHLGALLLHRLAELLAAGAARPPGKAEATWLAACRLIEERCDRPLGRVEVARALGIHANHLSRLLVAHPGGGFGERLRRLRLERAASLLDDPRLPLAEVARLCGFGGAHQLIRAHRAEHGTTPRRRR